MHRLQLLLLVLILVAVATPFAVLADEDANANSSGGDAALGGAPWGVQLEPRSVPMLPRKPPVAAPSGSARGALVSATPSTDWSPVRATPASSYDQPNQFAPLSGDVVPLDGLSPAAPPEIRVASMNQQTVAPANEMLTEPQPKLPPGTRDGVFQKVYATGTYLPALSSEPDAIGWTDFETGVVLGFPFLRRDTPLLVTPFFGAHFLDNVGPNDLSATLYDAAVEFRHLRKFGDGPWGMDVAATVGYYSDFQQSDGDALRVTGRGIVAYESSPTVKWVAGVAYLNRAGATVLPIAGVVYQPTPDVKWELVAPRPRVYRRLGGGTENDERWVYLGGEFGGGIWSFTHPSDGSLDLLSYSDYRLVLGYERKRIGGLSPRAEFGYVFNRHIEFEGAAPDLSLDDTIFARLGLTY